MEEDADTMGTGTWIWDKKTEALTVLLTIKTEVAGEQDKPKISKAFFQLKKEGKDLKITKEGWTPNNSYVGKVFKKAS